jgi:hypothetical protein
MMIDRFSWHDVDDVKDFESVMPPSVKFLFVLSTPTPPSVSTP